MLVFTAMMKNQLCGVWVTELKIRVEGLALGLLLAFEESTCHALFAKQHDSQIPRKITAKLEPSNVNDTEGNSANSVYQKCLKCVETSEKLKNYLNETNAQKIKLIA